MENAQLWFNVLLNLRNRLRENGMKHWKWIFVIQTQANTIDKTEKKREKKYIESWNETKENNTENWKRKCVENVRDLLWLARMLYFNRHIKYSSCVFLALVLLAYVESHREIYTIDWASVAFYSLIWMQNNSIKHVVKNALSCQMEAKCVKIWCVSEFELARNLGVVRSPIFNSHTYLGFDAGTSIAFHCKQNCYQIAVVRRSRCGAKLFFPFVRSFVFFIHRT